MDISRQVSDGIRFINNRFNSTTGWRGHLLRAACLALPFVIFALAAFGEAHAGLARTIRFNDPIILLLLGIFFFLAYRLKGWVGVLAGLTATLFVFALDLAGLWLAAESGSAMLIGGLLPWSDASAYLWGAQLLNAGAPLDAWHGRRPFFMSLFAVLLGVTQENLQWSNAILVAIIAVACFLFARSVRASHGAAAAVVALLVIWIFYSRFIGTPLSEHLGLALGAIALAVLWQSAQQSRLGLFWAVGLWLLTCALITRAGAFFVLPALLAWGIWHSYHTVSLRESLKVMAMGSAAIGAGFMLDSLLRHVLVPDAVPFGNFSYTLYGLIVGNKGWSRVLFDHPEIAQLGDAEAARYVYQLAFEAFRANPMSAVTGALGAWRDYFSYYGRGLFSFIPGGEPRLVACVLSGLGLANCLWRWREAPYSMILAITAGVFLSIPFVPPADSYSMRIYAATIPLMALLVGLGLAFIPSMLGAIDLPRTRMSPAIAASYGALLVLVTVVGAITLKLFSPSFAFEPLPCPAGQSNLYVRMAQGSSIHLVEDDARSHVPEVRLSDFKDGLRAYSENYQALYTELENLQAGQDIRFAINLAKARKGQQLWLVSDTLTTPKTGVVHICARLADNKATNVYYAQEIRAVPAQGD
jgi:hypothetical protein